MKILLVSWSILPNPGGSSVIVENLAKNFSRDELIVFGSRTMFAVKTPTRSAIGPRFMYYFTELYLFGRGYRYFIWFRKWRFRPLINKIKEVIRKEGIEYVIGVYPNDFYCHAASIAAKELNIPFSSYFHNTYVDNVAITDLKAQQIQDAIFKNSEFIFVMSKGMQRFYEKQYQLDNVLPLVHTFTDFPHKRTLSGLPGTKKEQYRLVAIGNFNESNMDATIRFAKAIKDDPRFSLSIYTHVPNLLLQKRGLDPDLVEHKGFVTPDAIHEILQQYDICILTHGFTGGYGVIEYQTIFPTRTIPFLLSGKPIFAHSPPGSFLNDFIEENQCAELVDQADEGAVIAGLERIINDVQYQEQLVEAATRTVQQFYGPDVASYLKQKIGKQNRS